MGQKSRVRAVRAEVSEHCERASALVRVMNITFQAMRTAEELRFEGHQEEQLLPLLKAVHAQAESIRDAVERTLIEIPE
jgi:hypothetical protein